MTIVVLAHPADEVAARLARRWRSQDALLMLPRDLSHPGWRMYVGGSGQEWFVAEGRRHATASLRGVLVRLPLIEASLLPHLHEDDREYMATEMTAFFIAWLNQLPCPVLNRASASSILGPSLGAARLKLIAARVGLTMHACEDRSARHASATVVGEQVLFAPDEVNGDDTRSGALAESALSLARGVGASLMTVHLALSAGRQARLRGAELLADMDRADIADAVLALCAAEACS